VLFPSFYFQKLKKLNAMLLKNDEPYELSPQDYKDIKKFFPKFPVRLKFPDNRVKKNPKNRTPDQPASISTPYFAIKKTDKGSESWRYYETVMHDINGVKIYNPTHLVLRGNYTITENDKELAFWLINASPYLKEGKNFNGRVPKYTIENLIGEAEIKAAKETLTAEVKALIYSDKVGLGEDKLRLIAGAYFIDGVKEMTFPQVRLALDHEIQLNKDDGFQKFLEISDADQTLTVRANLQKAIDHKLITYNKPKKEWAWVTDQGKANELITKVLPADAAKHKEALVNYYSGNQNFAEQIIEAVKTIKTTTEE
jgi:hypothetical protein